MEQKMNIFSLKNKTALVTGATGHLGKHMCQALAEAGATVIINSRNKKRCEELQKTLRIRGHKAEILPFDITDEKKVFENIKTLSNLDILVNNAYNGIGGTLETSNSTMYRDAYEMNVISAQNLIKASLPLLKKASLDKGDSSIINIISMYGLVSPDFSLYETPEGTNPPFYGASKAALEQLTKYSAVELAKYGIRVNAISPGPFPNEETQKKNPAFIKKLEKKIPLNRIGKPKDIQGPTLFLASDASRFVTGTTLKVDGGWTAW